MIGWSIETLIASTLLMALVMVLRGPVRRGFGPSVAYALWLLPPLRLLLPPLPASWRESAVAPIAAPLSHAGDTITVLVIEPLGLGAAAPANHHPSLGLVLAALWGAGAAAFLLWHWLAHVRFCRRMLAGSVPSENPASGVCVIESEAAAGPLAFGIWRKYVAFPRDFTERYDEDERDLALAHELGHHARGDLIANWAALIVLALHWFDPIAWRAFRAFRADQEMANDARVLTGRDAAFRHAYGRAIVKSAHGGAISAACHLHTIHALKGRLKMLSIAQKSRSRILGGAAAVGVLVLTGLGVTASGTQAAEGLRNSVGKTIGVDLSSTAHIVPVAATAPVALVRSAVAAAPVAQDDAAPAAETDAPLPPLPAPPVEAVDPVPPVPPVPAMAGDRTIQRVRIVRDGKLIRDDVMADMPEVSSENCRGGGGKDEMVINDRSGGKNRIIICEDRIAKVAEQGAAIAANSAEIERNAYRSALSGLREARAKMVADRRLSEAARREALASLDESIQEMQNDLAHAGGDD